MSNFEKIKEFHRVFGRTPDPTSPEFRDQAYQLLRGRLILEEFEEFLNELSMYLWREDDDDEITIVPPLFEQKPINPRKVAKELADLLYVVYGTAAAFGIDVDRAFAEVHESNMSKLGPNGEVLRREDGKILKSENYRPPSLDWLPESLSN